MQENSKIIVIAFKYNDILYALGTSEFREATFRKLVIFYITGRNPKDFPLQDIFDEVEYIKYGLGTVNMFANLIKICKMDWKCDVLTYSNPLLLATKYITNLSQARKVLLLEDGLMNYYPLTDIHYNSSRRIKELVQKLIGIEDKKVFANKELITYLLCPEMAVSYWGTTKRLMFDKDVIDKEHLYKSSFIKGKKFFIGQALYNTDGISKEYYVNTVNRIIQEYEIDYYVPHYCSADENIQCKYLNMQELGLTFEFLSSAYDFTVFSVSSTLLYSTKKINPSIKSYMVRMQGIKNDQQILQKTVDGIID